MVACPVEAICQLLDLTPTSAWQLANLTNAILARNQSLKSSCILTRTINQLFDSSSIMKPMRAIACTTPETPHGVHKLSLPLFGRFSQKGGILPPYGNTVLDSPTDSRPLHNMVAITYNHDTIIHPTNQHVPTRKSRCMDTLDSTFSTLEKINNHLLGLIDSKLSSVQVTLDS
ncbi:hypothetical protein Fot_42585 [Forsythia ovata]|uniref:Uncharacterized protein n=1 Tax=Forsythia ovata TaxID=205694 RepID=A0ABD1RND1_9LAMI